MKATDKVWQLNRFSGVSEVLLVRAVAMANSESFFVTEAEAWDADADRHERESQRHREQARSSERLAADARVKAQQCREASEAP